MDIQTVGVVGAGVMGRGVSQNLAQTGHHVVLLDVSSDILEQAKREIKQNIRFHSFFTKSALTDSPDEILARINFTTDYESLAKVDYVIENSTEKWAIKQEIYPQLDAICPEQCVFAANTSAISITRLMI